MEKNLLKLASILFLFCATSSLAQTNTISSTVSSTVSSSSNTVGTTTVDRTPSTASSPNVVINNSDICTTGVSGAVQTQILGISGGKAVRDLNCENLKLSKQLYSMGMKVAAVSLLCMADARVFQAMWDAGTYCPINGLIGKKAKQAWLASLHRVPEGALISQKENLAMLDKKSKRNARKPHKGNPPWPNYTR